MDQLPKEQLKLIYNDVIKGFSVSVYNEEPIYIKHLSNSEVADFDVQYTIYYDRAKLDGAPTTEEREKLLIGEGSWSEEKNREIANQKMFLDGLKATKAKSFRNADINNINNLIKEAEKKILDLEQEHANLLSHTAESFATKRINEYQILKSLFKEDFKTPLFDKDSFDNLSDVELGRLINSFNIKLKNLNERSLKRIALSGFFLNFFYLCKDDPYVFYGKPVVELTFFQAELFGHALYFKNILSNSPSKPPPDIADDPDKLTDWYNGIKSIKEEIDKGKKPEDMVGLSNKDREMYGIQGQNMKHEQLVKMAKAKGGELGFRDIISAIK